MMNKKLSVVLAVLLVAASSSVFAFGVGLQANANAGKTFAPGFALTFKLDSAPVIFAANWNIEKTIQIYGITGDFWAINNPITNFGTSSLNWFFGVGVFLNLTFPEHDDFRIATGLRIPVGINMFIADGVFEPFIQVAPSFGLRFIPSLGAEGLFWPMSAGFRIWFK